MYEPSRLVKAFRIAGFQHYDGALVLDRLKPGKKLKMTCCQDNPHDPNAVELRYKIAPRMGPNGRDRMQDGFARCCI